MADNKDWAEAAVLACSLLDRDAFYSTISRLTANDFHDPRNRIIYQTLLDINDQKLAIDLVNLLNALKTKGLLDEAGGETYIKGLEADMPPVAEADDYINSVKDNSLLRTFKDTLRSLGEEASTKMTDIPTFIGEAERKILDITATRRVAGFKTTGEVLDSLIGKLEETSAERMRTGKQPYLSGISTGFSTLDRITNGFQKGDLVIIAARPSVGKTALSINFADKVARAGKPVAFFSLEMSAEQIMGRLLANEASLSKNDIQALDFKTTIGGDGKKILEIADKDRGNPEVAAKFKSLKAAIAVLSAMPLYIDDNPGNKVVSIEAEVKKLMAQKPDLGLIIIDYLGLIQSAGARTSSQDNRQQVVSDISRALKGMARTLKVPVIALSQLSRDSEKRTDHMPVLSDLRDSGAIEQDADQVMLIYRPDQGDSDKNGTPEPPSDNDISNISLIIAKNRNGRTGSVDFIFEKALSRFSLASPDDDEENEEPETPPLDGSF